MYGVYAIVIVGKGVYEKCIHEDQKIYVILFLILGVYFSCLVIISSILDILGSVGLANRMGKSPSTAPFLLFCSLNFVCNFVWGKQSKTKPVLEETKMGTESMPLCSWITLAVMKFPS